MLHRLHGPICCCICVVICLWQIMFEIICAHYIQTVCSQFSLTVSEIFLTMRRITPTITIILALRLELVIAYQTADD